jgi:hypothetical protein
LDDQQEVRNYHPDSKKGFDECKEEIVELCDTVSNLYAQNQQQFETIQEMAGMMRTFVNAGAQSPATRATLPSPPLAPPQPQAPRDQAAARALGTSISRNSVPIIPTAAVAAEAANNLNTDPFTNLSLLLPLPRFAEFSNTLPANFTAVLTNHRHQELGRYIGTTGRRAHWGTGVAIALHRRLYLFNVIDELAKVLPTRPQHRHRNMTMRDWQDFAATALDKKHEGISLPKVLDSLKKASSLTKKRKSRKDVAAAAMGLQGPHDEA